MGPFVPYTVEPLYKGQVEDGSFVPYTVEPFYKGQVGVGPLSLIQWSLSTRDKLGICPLYKTVPNLSFVEVVTHALLPLFFCVDVYSLFLCVGRCAARVL